MNLILVVCSSGLLLITSCTRAIAQTSDFALLNTIPSNSGFDFRSEKMIRVVNHLRHLGKDQALLVLSNYVQEVGPVTPENVVLICRVLFVNSNSWTIQLPGTPNNVVNANIIGKFPLFPVALSEGVPFLLVEGYRGSGFFGNPPAACVEYCKGLQMISADLTNTNYEAASQSLMGSKEFKELYNDPSDESWIAFMIQRQAGGTNEFIELPNGRRRIVPLSRK